MTTADAVNSGEVARAAGDGVAVAHGHQHGPVRDGFEVIADVRVFAAEIHCLCGRFSTIGLGRTSSDAISDAHERYDDLHMQEIWATR